MRYFWLKDSHGICVGANNILLVSFEGCKLEKVIASPFLNKTILAYCIESYLIVLYFIHHDFCTYLMFTHSSSFFLIQRIQDSPTIPKVSC